MPDRRRATRIVAEVDELQHAFVLLDPEGDGGVSPVEEAYARGREEGLEQGRQQALADYERQVEELRGRLAESLEQLLGLREQLNREHESLLVELALEAASKIVRRRIDDGDPVAARALEEAIGALPTSGTISARLNPDDLETVRRELADAIARHQVELEGDDSIGRGGCVVQSPSGTVDATVETATRSIGAAARGGGETS